MRYLAKHLDGRSEAFEAVDGRIVRTMPGLNWAMHQPIDEVTQWLVNHDIEVHVSMDGKHWSVMQRAKSTSPVIEMRKRT